jgi:hypothetical protein
MGDQARFVPEADLTTGQSDDQVHPVRAGDQADMYDASALVSLRHCWRGRIGVILGVAEVTPWPKLPV